MGREKSSDRFPKVSATGSFDDVGHARASQPVVSLNLPLYVRLLSTGSPN